MPLTRRAISPRPDWRQTARDIDYGYFTNADKTEAWNENSAYFMTPDGYDQIRKASERLFEMCLRVINEAINTPNGLDAFHIPKMHQDYVRASWNSPSINNFLIGRFDLAWHEGQIKLIEFNADTPATLPESTLMQQIWLRDYASTTGQKGLGNPGLRTDLILDTLADIFAGGVCADVHIVPYPDNLEDATHARYWQKWVTDAGGQGIICDIRSIRVNASGHYTHNGRVIQTMLKMYPWELMLREEGSRHLATAHCDILNPAWTSLLSNKHLLVALWNKYPGDPLLLQTGYTPDGMTDYVAKPVHGRGGENVSIFQDKTPLAQSPGSYGIFPMIYQERAKTTITPTSPVTTSVGAWILSSNGHFGGITFREDRSPIIRESSAITPAALTHQT